MKSFFQPILLLFLGVSAITAADSTTAKPTAHTEQLVEGWTLKVDSRLLAGDDVELGRRALKLLASRMADIKDALPEDKVTRLQQVVIWLDLTHGELTSAQYHPSAAWLKRNGYDEALEKCVHIPDAKVYVSASHQRVQPWSLLHELAHAYHDQVLDFEQPEIEAAWQRVKDSGRFERVLHINGPTVRHYALTNAKEFFAEMTEAYFGTNDFYPFNRAELKQSEPEVYKLLEQVWTDTDNSSGQAAQVDH